MASTPKKGSISKLVWSPFTHTEWLIDSAMFNGIGDSATDQRVKNEDISFTVARLKTDKCKLKREVEPAIFRP